MVNLSLCALLWLPLAARPALQPADPVQAHVDAVHAESAALRRELLTAWTFEPDARPSPGYYAQNPMAIATQTSPRFPRRFSAFAPFALRMRHAFR